MLSAEDEKKAQRKAWFKAYEQRPEVKAKRKLARERPEVVAKRKAYEQTPEYKAKRATPEYKANKKAWSIVHGQRPEVKAKRKKYHEAFLLTEKGLGIVSDYGVYLESRVRDVNWMLEDSPEDIVKEYIDGCN